MRIKSLTNELYSAVENTFTNYEDREEAGDLSYLIVADVIGTIEQETGEDKAMESFYAEFVTDEKKEKLLSCLEKTMTNFALKHSKFLCKHRAGALL